MDLFMDEHPSWGSAGIRRVPCFVAVTIQSPID
jgi:hypothetical protein